MFVHGGAGSSRAVNRRALTAGSRGRSRHRQAQAAHGGGCSRGRARALGCSGGSISVSQALEHGFSNRDA